MAKSKYIEYNRQYILDRIILDKDKGCWLWTKSLSNHKYGKVTIHI
jgi:hypothetical protein